MTAIRSWAGYATVLRALQVEPRTTAQLAVDLSAAHGGLQILLGRMCDLGLVHECDWVQLTPRAQRVPVWAFGKVGRVPYPTTGKLPVRNPKGYRNRPALIAFACIVRSLVSAPSTALAISESTGCERNQLYKLLLHCERIGFARVAAWEVRDDCNGRPSAVWALSNGVRPRAPRPATLTRKEIYARSWARKAALRDMLRITRALTSPAVSAALEPAELEAA